jgi:hypothetical protein
MNHTERALAMCGMAALGDDLFAFEISALAWRRISLDGAVPTPRSCLGLAGSNGSLYLFGGLLDGMDYFPCRPCADQIQFLNRGKNKVTSPRNSCSSAKAWHHCSRERVEPDPGLSSDHSAICRRRRLK